MAQRKLEKTPEENRKTVDLVSRLEFRRRRRRNERCQLLACDPWKIKLVRSWRLLIREAIASELMDR
jgi:hypothetical protein